ncbi:HAD-IA family hydrolase [Candidatus Aquiluna sp. UB-MaderosW2red]|uniref:HAD-IA family hydrolase n=1 Tax=Candidatus Aquiluna sp. UB-MaderosW2red TaxID=1855377 RepID=UPI000875CD46|nr:HAD-IA family hydrolase [Candidatus Aquiluna sp. UB-MaderosW2red]SCX15507.1 sugar-phosphatase [Candidatus Aquiluna sp. UB-MaderosW2red]
MLSFYQGLLFDNDGVLVESMHGATEAWRLWGKEFSPGFELLQSHHGMRAQDLVLELVGAENFKVANDRINQLELKVAHLTTALKGAVELTTSLVAGTWTVVTSANQELAAARLTAAGMPIPKELVSATDVSKGKPDPEPYLLGAKRLGLDISECVVFEDAAAGIQAGLEAGAGLLVGVTEYAMDTQADLVVSSLMGITFKDGELFIPDSLRLR